MERISTKTIGAQLEAMMGLGAALDAVRASGIKSIDLSSDERGVSALEDCAAEYLAELTDEAMSRIHEIFVDVGGRLEPRGKGRRAGDPALTVESRARIVDVLTATGWKPAAIEHMLDIVTDSVADGCFLPEPSGAPTVSAPTPADEGEAAAAREGVTFVEPDDASSLMPAGELAPTTGIPVGAPPRPVPVPVHVTLGDASTIVEALELLHDMADAHEDVPSEADAVKRHTTALVSKFKAVIARNAGTERPELTDAELKARGLRRLEQGDVMDQVVEVDGHEYMPIDAPCPGCGCKAGEGLTPTCSHPAGCGFWRELEIEPVPTSLLEVAAAVERKTPAEILAARLPGSSVRPVAVIGDGVTVLEVTSPAGTDPKTIEAAAAHLGELEAARLIATPKRPLPYEPDAPTVLRGPGGITLTLDVREANVEDPGAGTPALVSLELNGRTFTASFECAMGERTVAGDRGEAPLAITQVDWLEEQQRHVDELWRQARERHAVSLARREQICGALPSFEGAGPCERDRGHEGQHAARGKRWDADPTSSACKREPWCVLQVGHEGPCLPTMMRDGSF
jgi:hypothetical protein